MKTLNWYNKVWYKQLSLTNKIFFWLSLLGIILGIFLGGNYIINLNTSDNKVIIQNSTLTDSPIFQGSSNISVIYNNPPESDIHSEFYSKEFSVNIDYSVNGGNYNFYFMKFILPDDQELLMDKILFNTTYKIASCNNELTDCYIYHKYRNKEGFNDDDVCWIYTTRFGHEEIGSDTVHGGKRLSKNPQDCSKTVIKN